MYAFEEIESTNGYALNLLERGIPNGTVILANHQTAGKGRLGRTWHSPANSNLYLSIILNQTPAQALISWIPLMAGVAVAEAIEEVSNLSVALKWPNDIVSGAKKLGGVLCEGKTKGPNGWGAIVGIGINVNSKKFHFPHHLQGIATSLAMETTRQFDRLVLAATLLSKMECLYECLLAADLQTVRSSYVSHSSTLGRHVQVRFLNGEVKEGFAHDIGSEGELQLIPSTPKTVSTTPPPSPIEIRAGDITHLR